MLDFIRAGGLGMIFVILFGGATLLMAVLFAATPEARRLGTIRSMTVATAFSIGAAVTSNMAAVLFKVPANPEWAKSPEIHLIIMQGFGESLTPAILGCAVLSLVWFVMTAGIRRLSYELEA